jgi:hypothetical protein
MPNVDRVSASEFRGGIQKDIANTLDDWHFLALPDIQYFQEATIALAEVENVAKHVVDKVVELVRVDNSWICVS